MLTTYSAVVLATRGPLGRQAQERSSVVTWNKSHLVYVYAFALKSRVHFAVLVAGLFSYKPDMAKLLCLSLLLLVQTALCGPKLNVLLIVSDDLRDTVGCYGNTSVKTPNIDRLARRGVRFEHAYAQYPVCNPSRTSFLTGLRCEQTGVVENRVMFRAKLPDIVTLPQLMRQNGWYAASFGKIYHIGGTGPALARWIDTGRSWDVAEVFQATEAGRVIAGRNLTGGALKWCEWGATPGTDDDDRSFPRHSRGD